MIKRGWSRCSSRGFLEAIHQSGRNFFVASAMRKKIARKVLPVAVFPCRAGVAATCCRELGSGSDVGFGEAWRSGPERPSAQPRPARKAAAGTFPSEWNRHRRGNREPPQVQPSNRCRVVPVLTEWLRWRTSPAHSTRSKARAWSFFRSRAKALVMVRL